MPKTNIKIGTCDDIEVKSSGNIPSFKCPRCKATENFDINATVTVRCTPYTMELINGDLSIHYPYTVISCIACGCSGTIHLFMQ